MNNEYGEQTPKHEFDLEERTAKFGESIIDFCKRVPKNSITNPLITQLVKSGTSIGANYWEANNAESRADFEHKIGISRKESKETCYWLRMILRACPELREAIGRLRSEAEELNKIFSASLLTSKANPERARSKPIIRY